MAMGGRVRIRRIAAAVLLALALGCCGSREGAAAEACDSAAQTPPPPPLPPLPNYRRFTIDHTYWLPAIAAPQEPPAPTAGNRTPYPIPGWPPAQSRLNRQLVLDSYCYANVAMLNADRTRLLTLRATDTNAYVWDLTRGELLATLKSPTAQLYRAAISPDGRLVMTLADDGNGTLWDVATETILKQTATTTEDQVFFVSDTQLVWLHAADSGNTGYSYGYSPPTQWNLELCALPNLAQLSKIDAMQGHELEFGRVTVGKSETDGSITVFGLDGKVTAPTVLCKIPALTNQAGRVSGWQGQPVTVRRRPDGRRVLVDRGRDLEEWELPAGRRVEFLGAVVPPAYTPDSRYRTERSNAWVRGDNRESLQFHDQLGSKTTHLVPCETGWRDFAISADSRVVAMIYPGAVELRDIPDQNILGQLVSARIGDPPRAILFPAATDRILLCFEDRVEEWGPETDPLPHESDRAWTVYMDQMGLKHSLFTAAVYGSPAEIKQAMADHPDWLTAMDDAGGTPLMYAIAAGRIDAVEILLAAGADPNHADRNGNLPMTLAFMDWNLPMLRLLEQYGAKVPASWGNKFYSPNQRNDPHGRRYGLVLLTAPQDPATTWHDILNWLVDHDLEADPWQIALAVHGYERTNLPLAQKIYNRFQRVPILYLVVMQLLLIGIALLRIRRLRQQALDPVQQQAQRDSLRLRVYHESAWGDDSVGQLGLYPEEQRQLAALKHQRDAVLAAPLPMVMGWIGVVSVAAAIPYWWNVQLMQYNTLIIALTGLSWIFGHLQSTRMRLRMHWLGLVVGVAGAAYGMTVALFLPGISDFFAREIYFVAGISAIPLVVLYGRNLKLLTRIIRMEDQLAAVAVHSNEEVRSESGWDERHPEVY